MDAARLIALAARAETAVDAGRAGAALRLADEAIRLAPERPEGFAARARALRASGDARGALAALDAVLARDPACAPAHDARAVLLAEGGRLADSRAAYEQALRCDPRLARAHFGLASLGAVAPAHRAAMERLAADPASLDERQRLFLLYALAKTYDEDGDVARAFACAQAGAALRRARWRGDAEAERMRLAQAGPAGAGEGQGDPAAKPIFVFGMPRSGTTLVEQILASHPQVAALGETEGFAAAARDEREPAAQARAYLAQAPAKGRRLVDKSLGNVLHMTAIRRAFPRAKFVSVRRDPFDACLSIFFSYFGADMPFPPDLEGVGRYARAHADLTSAWRAALPASALHEVVYERLVADFEGETRALLSFCGLSWDARCLAFHETVRPVATASVAQVRRPIYGDSVGRARRYAAHLEPLRRALELGENVAGV